MPDAATVPRVIANGTSIPIQPPLSLQDFLVAQGLLPRSVVVELNGEPVAPSRIRGSAPHPGGPPRNRPHRRGRLNATTVGEGSPKDSFPSMPHACQPAPGASGINPTSVSSAGMRIAPALNQGDGFQGGQAFRALPKSYSLSRDRFFEPAPASESRRRAQRDRIFRLWTAPARRRTGGQAFRALPEILLSTKGPGSLNRPPPRNRSGGEQRDRLFRPSRETAGIRNEAEEARRTRRLEKLETQLKNAGEVMPEALRQLARCTQHSVKLIRWLLSCLFLPTSCAASLGRLRALYRTS